MPEEPLTLSILVRFHREVMMPDVERLIDQRFAGYRRETNGHFDALYKRFDRLETEYHALVAGVQRVEERLDRIEARLDRVEARLDRVGARLGGVDERLDALEATTRAELTAVNARLAAIEEAWRGPYDPRAVAEEMLDLKARVKAIEAQVSEIEGRLPPEGA